MPFIPRTLMMPQLQCRFAFEFSSPYEFAMLPTLQSNNLLPVAIAGKFILTCQVHLRCPFDQINDDGIPHI